MLLLRRAGLARGLNGVLPGYDIQYGEAGYLLTITPLLKRACNILSLA